MRSSASILLALTLLVVGGCQQATVAIPDNAIPVRVASFDPTIRKHGVNDAQLISIEVLRGPRSGEIIDVHLLPSKETAKLVGKTIYLKTPLTIVTAKEVTYNAGAIFNLHPISVNIDPDVTQGPDRRHQLRQEKLSSDSTLGTSE